MLKKTIDSLRFSKTVLFHPFKGFWALKHEGKGQVLASCIIIALLIITFILDKQITGFLLNDNTSRLNIFIQITSVVVPFLLWCISNWCITTLVDGEGKFKDIFITTAFALVPIIIIHVPLAVISNILTNNEIQLYTFCMVLSTCWSAMLLVVGIMTIHQFTLSKTILTIVIALVGMIIMIFLFLLFFALIQQIINFVILLIKEIEMRQ